MLRHQYCTYRNVCAFPAHPAPPFGFLIAMPCLHYGMGGLAFYERSRIRETSAMKWNTPDWWFGLLAGAVFGFYIAMSFVDKFSSDARSYIAIFGLVGFFVVTAVRAWHRQKNPPTSTQR